MVVARDGDPVTATRKTETELEHQPYTAATARLAAHVVVD